MKILSEIQLDLFESYDEFAEMKKYLYKTNCLVKSIQGGVFRRIDDQKKHILSLYDEIEELKFEIQKLRRDIKNG